MHGSDLQIPFVCNIITFMFYILHVDESDKSLECDSAVVKSMVPVKRENVTDKEDRSIQSVNVIHGADDTKSGAKKKTLTRGSTSLGYDQTMIPKTNHRIRKLPRSKAIKPASNGVKLLIVDQPRSDGLRFGTDTSCHPPMSSKLKGQKSRQGMETGPMFCVSHCLYI